MAYAGMATATGQYLEIPIVLRSLVTSLSLITKANFPVPFDSAFIALLEVGTSDEEFGRVVKKYAYNWWDKSREPEDSQLLHPEILDECLNYHEEQLLKSNEPRKVVPHQEIEVTLPFQLPESGAEQGAEAGAEFQPVMVKVRGGDAELEECRHCAENQCIIMGGLCSTLFDEIKATQRYVSAMGVSSRAEVSVASRRCAEFFRLHERVQEKELVSESITVEGTGRGTVTQKTSRRVAEIAAGELERYQAMASSERWTWGATLMKDEVLDLRHIRKQEVRTGYGTNLPQGTLSGEYSATNTSPPRSANVSAVPHSVERVPSPTSLLFPSDIGSYALNSASGAEDATGPGVMEPEAKLSEKTDEDEAEQEDEEDNNVTALPGDQPMEVDEVLQSMAVGTEEEDAASVAAEMWFEDVTQLVAGGAQAGMSIQVEEDDNEEDAVSLAADLWLETLSGAAGGAEDAPAMNVVEEEEHKDDEDDATSLAADIWLEAEGTQSVAGCAEPTAPTNEHEGKDDEEDNEEEDNDKDNDKDNEEDDVNDAASVAADAWLMGDGIQSVAGGATPSAPTNEEDDEDDVNDAASVAADAWLMGEGTHLVARIAKFSPFNNAEVEDDEDDPASLAADMWFGAQGIESGVAEADDECEGVNPASLTAELWFSAPRAISRAEDEDDDDDDSASVAADMWFQDEQQTMSANISHAGHSNMDANSSVPPKIYTPAFFLNEWLEDNADGEHEVDVGMADLHLTD